MPACPDRSHADAVGLGPALPRSEVDAAWLGAHGGLWEERYPDVAAERPASPPCPAQRAPSSAGAARWLWTMRPGRASLPAGSSRSRHQQPQESQSESPIVHPGHEVESDL
ncbi:nuclear receptor subfamily 4 group A member 3 [Platysternon megacephalum]|uniref:Nuclear receptor subfamily 4 group A member 3 n=1 Tax=Platysternon megacephalum TaxID=55544 RepID=A0A4D9DYB4_9SAUR|nr:nuclear receptor subfamily 4 group A member 3 [Platysternon megacephalum]